MALAVQCEDFCPSCTTVILYGQTQQFSQMADKWITNWVTPDHVTVVQSLLGVDRGSTEMKFITEQHVFIVESFARKKHTENVSKFCRKYPD
jgi:hypothetical protein